VEATLVELDKKLPAKPRIIDSITFEAVSLSQSEIAPSSTLLRQVKSKPGDRIVAESLAADVARLYATGMFDMVDYECRRVGDGRYKLVFLLTASSGASLGFNLRYDREYNVQGLAELTIRNLFGTGSYTVISARFGETGHDTATLRLIHPRLPMLYIEPQVQILTTERFEFNPSQGTAAFLDKRRGAQVMLGATLRKRFEMSAGYRFETERFVPKAVHNNREAGANLSGLCLHLRRDTLDHQEFRHSGMNLEIAGNLKARNLGADWSYSIIKGQIRRYFSPSDKTTFMVRFEGFKSGGTLPGFERAYLGGYRFSDTDSYRFAGYRRDEFMVPNMVLAGVAYRRRLFSNPLGFIGSGYLSMEYNLAGMESGEAARANFDRVAHGGAIGIDFNTMIGPIRLALGIGENGKPRTYISLGPSF
jgi:NTE family protein